MSTQLPNDLEVEVLEKTKHPLGDEFDAEKDAEDNYDQVVKDLLAA